MRIKNQYEVRYIVNDSVVIAIAEVKMYDNKFMHYKWIYDSACCYIDNKSDSIQLREEFKGIARLKNGDMNDIKTAKRIARCKALRQANGYFGDTLGIFLNKLWKLTNQMNDMRENAFEKRYDYDIEIRSLTLK